MPNQNDFWRCRIAPSLGEGFAGTPNEVWGVHSFDANTKDPTVFFGMYGLPDFFALWRYLGPKYILWAGSDITHLKNGYWLDHEGENRIPPGPMAKWIQENTISYVENEVEKEELQRLGITSIVVPSFLGDVEDYPLLYKPTQKLKFYTSVSGNDFKLYGWDDIEDLSDDFPEIEFHLYGNSEPWYTDKPNIFVHGRVSQLEMNQEIKKMTGALRLTRHDGFSEILAKSVLWGQWPVSPYINYPHIAKDFKSMLKKVSQPNLEGRDYYLKELNRYPWNVKNN